VLSIGAIVDPTLVPDPWFYAECLKESYAELRAAADQAAAPAAPSTPAIAAPRVASATNDRREEPVAVAAR
jgi:hypothetical protein